VYAGTNSNPGNNALVVYTLLKSGLPTHHEVIERGFEALRQDPPTDTYGRALMLMALAAHHEPADKRWAEKTTKALLGSQSGDFGYGTRSRGDLSNTQYGALGMRAAEQLGIDVPKSAWLALAKKTLGYTQSGFGFSYVSSSKGAQPSGSMTSAGAAILSICVDALRADGVSEKKLERFASARDHGLEWLGVHFSVDRNEGGGWLGYYLYGLERVGSLCEVDRLGSHDWYNEGAAKLVREQRQNGHWSLGGSGPVTSTCFALLFLRRATRLVESGAPPSDKTSFTSSDPRAAVALVATGDRDLDVWLGNWKRSALERLEWPGEKGKGLHVVRVRYFLDHQEVATVEGSAKLPSGTERFPARLQVTGGGPHHLSARIEVAPPPHTIQGVELASAHELITTGLDFELPDTLEQWQVDNAADYARNLVPLSGASAKASSTADRADLQAALRLGADFPLPSHAELAIDNRTSSAWIAKASDATPTLTLRFKRPQKANRVVIANAHLFERVQKQLGRVATVTVVVNSRYEFKLSMPPDERIKARLELPKVLRISKLEVRITSRVPGASGYRGVGLGEVELQLVE
jgi:hypothetical protein